MKKITVKLLSLSIALCGLLLSKNSFAQTVYTIPSSGLLNGAYSPIDLCDAEYSAEADIFPSSSLAYGTVTKIAYDQISGSQSNVPIKIYLASTSATAFSSDGTWSSVISGATLVFSGNVSFTSSGWKTITLTTPFNYTSGNLEIMIETDWGTTTTCSNNPIFYYYTASGNSDEFWAGSANSSSALQSETGIIGNEPAPVQVTITSCSLPSITVQPSTSSQNVCQNVSATALSVTATGSTLTYQWYKNTTNSNSGGTAISGATSSSYTPSTSATGTLYYYCIVYSNGACAVTSNVSGAINVNPIPSISSQSTGTQTLCQGSTATAMSVTATGSTLTYQWYSNSANSNSGGTLISGATSSSYTPSTTTTGTLYYYCLVYSNGACPVTSAVSGAIIVNGTSAPTGATPQLFCSSSNPTVANLTATGTAIQWYAAASGGTALASSTSLTSGTTYYATQTVSGCQSVSRLAVTATINTVPVITSQSTGPQSVCKDSFAISLSVNATGTSLTYQWYKDTAAVNSGGTLISGATSSSYKPSTHVPGTWYYYCVVSGAAPCASVTSSVSGAIVSYLCNINGLPAGGDLSGTYPNPTVAKINGMTVPASSTGYLFNNGSGTLSWSQNGIWGVNGTSLFYNGGNVGIGTNTPKYPLEVYGNIASADTIFGVDIYAQNTLSVGNFKFSNGSFVGAPDSITSKAPKLLLSAQKLSLVADSVSMPGIVKDTVPDLMQIDKKGNITPLSSNALFGLLYKKPIKLNFCNGIKSPLPNILPFNIYPDSTGPGVTEFVPCLNTGFSTKNPDAIVSINSAVSSAANAFTVGRSSILGDSTANGTLTDVFTIDPGGNTTMTNLTTGGATINNGASIFQGATIQGPVGINQAPDSGLGALLVQTTPNAFASIIASPSNAGGYGIMANVDYSAYANLKALVVHNTLYCCNGGPYDAFFVTGNGNIYTNGTISVHNPHSGNFEFTVDTLGNTFIPTGKMSIGVASNDMPGNYRLYVKGGILTEHCRVAKDSSTDWSDYVFSKSYKLTSLDSLEAYIKQNHHLKDVPSTEEVTKNGIDVAQMDAQLLKKIEELTLYVIQLQKDNATLKQEMEALKK